MNTQATASYIVETLASAGHIAYFAGGWVRDFLMDHPSNDVDIATSATPEEVIALFSKTITVGISFGVVIVMHDGEQYEVTSFRKEGRYLDGRKPESIEKATPEEDAQRRDFTINGMFYDPLQNRILDFVGGKQDIENKIIRTIGNADERFSEDRLRMVRAVRFAERFGFTIEPQTERAIKTHAHTLLPAVSMERIWQELRKMHESPRFPWALATMHRLGLLQEILPDLRLRKTPPLHIATFERFPSGCPLIIAIAELLPDASLHHLLEVCDTLKVSNKDRKIVTFYMRIKEISKDAEPVEWAHVYADSLSTIILEVLAAHIPTEDHDYWLAQHGNRREKLQNHIERIRANKPLITASKLQEEYGIQPGKQMGKLLQEAERIAINGNIEDTEIIIAQLKESALWP